MPHKIPPLHQRNGYWVAQPYLEDGTRPTWSFGSLKKVTQSQAKAMLRQRLNTTPSPAPTHSPSPLLKTIAGEFVAWADTYYRRADGTPTGEAAVIGYALKPLVRILGNLDAAAFRPRHLKQFVGAQIRDGVARTTIAARIAKIKRMFRWAKDEELIPPHATEYEITPQHVFDAIRDFAPPAAGRTKAREPDPVEAVDEAIVVRTMRYLPPTIAAMVNLQRLSGARPDEVCRMRPVEIDSSDATWVYQPAQHKTAHRKKTRRVLLGPRAREIIAARIPGRPVDAYLFSPAEADAERRGHLPPEWCAEPHPRPDCRQRFTVRSYRQAIWYACHNAFPAPEELTKAIHAARSLKRRRKPVPEALAALARKGRDWQLKHHWSPNQLRHLGLSEVNRAELERIAEEAAQTVAGHGDRRTTQRYLRREEVVARAIIERVG